jgi:hypothetical protein
MLAPRSGAVCKGPLPRLLQVLCQIQSDVLRSPLRLASSLTKKSRRRIWQKRRIVSSSPAPDARPSLLSYAFRAFRDGRHSRARHM